MSEIIEESTEKPKSIFGVIIHSFFIIPFLLAVFSVLLFTSVRILTSEQKTAFDYLEDVKTGGLTKRWQAAFELSKVLAHPKLIPDEERFSNELIAAFEQSNHDDDRVRQYLALAMGRTGNPKYVPVLLKNIGDEKNENLYSIVYALGILSDKRATNILASILENRDNRLRLIALMALGHIKDPKAVVKIRPLLYDSEVNIQWEAAVALAKMNDGSGKEILLQLLNRHYLSQFSEVDPQEQNHVMLVAMEAAAMLGEPEVRSQLKKLSVSDKNMKVRQRAYDLLKENG